MIASPIGMVHRAAVAAPGETAQASSQAASQCTQDVAIPPRQVTLEEAVDFANGLWRHPSPCALRQLQQGLRFTGASMGLTGMGAAYRAAVGQAPDLGWLGLWGAGALACAIGAGVGAGIAHRWASAAMGMAALRADLARAAALRSQLEPLPPGLWGEDQDICALARRLDALLALEVAEPEQAARRAACAPWALFAATTGGAFAAAWGASRWASTTSEWAPGPGKTPPPWVEDATVMGALMPLAVFLWSRACAGESMQARLKRAQLRWLRWRLGQNPEAARSLAQRV